MLFDGSVREAFDPLEARTVVEKLIEKGAHSVAICFLHSYANPAHEQLAEKLVRELLPTAFVCSSAAVLSQFREYSDSTLPHSTPISVPSCLTISKIYRSPGKERL